MSDNINAVLRALIADMDKESLSRAIPAFKRIMSTPEGQELVRRIQSSDRAALVKLLGNLRSGGDPAEVLERAAKNPGQIRNITRILDREVGK